MHPYRWWAVTGGPTPAMGRDRSDRGTTGRAHTGLRGSRRGRSGSNSAAATSTRADAFPGSPGADGRREHLLARLLPAADAGMRSLRGLEQRGAVRPVDPSTLTAIAMLALPAAAASWHHLAVTGVPQRSFEEFIDAFSDLLTYGLLPR